MTSSVQPGGCVRLIHELHELSKPYLLISDVHLDNPKCDRKLLTKHLDEAVERGAGILCFGDFFDAMQSKMDRRHNKADLREELKVANYLDNLVYSAAEFLAPYKNNLTLLGIGNHESKYLQLLETDLLERLIRELDVPNLYKGGYHGFIRFQHSITTTSRRTTTMYYSHGNWGGIIGKGTQSIVRYASIAPDADIVVSGHIHEYWAHKHAQFKLTQNGTMKVVPQLHIKCGTYKEEYCEPDGWAIEKISMPKVLGGWWLTFQQEGENIVAKVSMT